MAKQRLLPGEGAFLQVPASQLEDDTSING